MPRLTKKLVLKIITNNIKNAANVNIYPDAIFGNDEIDYSSDKKPILLVSRPLNSGCYLIHGPL